MAVIQCVIVRQMRTLLHQFQNLPRKIKIIFLVLVILGAIGAYIGWDRGFREHPQPDWVTATPETVKAAFTKENDVFAEIGVKYINPIQYCRLAPRNSRKCTF